MGFTSTKPPTSPQPPDPVHQAVSRIWRIVQEDQEMCQHRHCIGGREACLRIKEKIETEFATVLAQGSRR